MAATERIAGDYVDHRNVLEEDAVGCRGKTAAARQEEGYGQGEQQGKRKALGGCHSLKILYRRAPVFSLILFTCAPAPSNSAAGSGSRCR